MYLYNKYQDNRNEYVMGKDKYIKDVTNKAFEELEKNNI